MACFLTVRIPYIFPEIGEDNLGTKGVFQFLEYYHSNVNPVKRYIEMHRINKPGIIMTLAPNRSNSFPVTGDIRPLTIPPGSMISPD